MAEGRIGKHRDARLVAHAAREAGGLLGDVGELLGVRHVVHGGVGDEHRAAAAERDRHADDAVAGLGVDDAADVVERGRIVAGDAGDHRVGVAQRHHAGGEMVAVVVDQPLAVAEEIALALQALVEDSRHRRRCGCDSRALMISMPGWSRSTPALRGVLPA